MIKEKARVSSSGRMEEFMMVCGKMGNNTEEVNLQQKKELRDKENGIKEERQDG